MRSIGIDIGRYSIKVVEILATNRQYQVTNAKEYKILKPENDDHEIDILQTLNRISKEFDTESAKTVASIRQQYVSSRKLFFPFKERIKIQKSLAFELEDDIPLSIDKAVYDSKIIRYHAESTEIVAMACVIDEIEKSLDLFNRGHVDPDLITPEFSAVANLYENFQEAPSDNEPENQQPDKMILHLGHSKSFVGVISKGSLVWGRSIMWGAEMVARSIAKNFQIPVHTANEMMPEKAFIITNTVEADEDQVRMSDAVTKALAPLCQSLRLTGMLANTEYNVNVQSIEVIGGASGIKNLAAHLTQALELPTNVTNPLTRIPNPNLQGYQQLPVSFQMAVGLAIEGLKRPINPPVNFRQDELAKKNQSFERFIEKWGYSLKVAAAAWAAFLIYGITIDGIASSLEETSNDTLIEQAGKIANLKGRQASQRGIKKYIKDNNKKAKMVKLYDEISEINSPVKWINDISQVLPDNEKDRSFDVRRFSVSNSEIQIEGVAIDQKTIDKIAKALKNVAIKQKLKNLSPTINKEQNKKLFAYSFKVKRKN